VCPGSVGGDAMEPIGLVVEVVPHQVMKRHAKELAEFSRRYAQCEFRANGNSQSVRSFVFMVDHLIPVVP
jgi:hypothetical protein